VGALFPKGDSAIAVGPALMVVYVIVGAIGPAGIGNNMPWFMRIFQVLTPIKPTCEALCISELKNWQKESNTLTYFYHASNYSFCLRPIALASGQKENVLIGFVKTIGNVVGSIFRRPLDPIRDDKNPILESLGIAQSTTIRNSMLKLFKMTAGHIAVALLGMLFNSRSQE